MVVIREITYKKVRITVSNCGNIIFASQPYFLAGPKYYKKKSCFSAFYQISETSFGFSADL
jgi:hypothetical protein